MRGDRPLFLLGLLLFLAVCYLIASASRGPAPTPKQPPLFSSAEAFYGFVNNQSITLPSGGSLLVHRDRIESLRIESMSEGDQVTFDLVDDGGQYTVSGFVSLHNTEGTLHPIINLGKGWDVSKSQTGRR